MVAVDKLGVSWWRRKPGQEQRESSAAATTNIGEPALQVAGFDCRLGANRYQASKSVELRKLPDKQPSCRVASCNLNKHQAHLASQPRVGLFVRRLLRNSRLPASAAAATAAAAAAAATGGLELGGPNI